MVKGQAHRMARVLVVDANTHIRRLIGTLLRAMSIPGYAEARSPADAAAQARRQPPDLVIVDLTGDPTEALLFVHRLRRGEFGNPAVPVLGMTAACHHAVLDYARASGVTDIIGKPVSAIEVIGQVGALLQNPGQDCPPRLAAE